MTKSLEIKCPYCGGNSVLTDSAEVYGGKSYGMIWLCRPCDAYVGVHKHSKIHKPLGRLANKELRKWKVMAHEAFDSLWKLKMTRENLNKNEARGFGYKRLAERLEIEFKDCHIGMFDVDMCKKVVKICSVDFSPCSGCHFSYEKEGKPDVKTKKELGIYLVKGRVVLKKEKKNG